MIDQAQSASVRTAIEHANQQFMAAFQRQDARGIAVLYTDQGQALPPGGHVAHGHAAIEQVWQGAFGAGLKIARLETDEVEGFNETAYEVGHYTLEGAGGQVADRGKYLVIWKRRGSQWLLHRDIWNSNGAAS